MNTRRILRWSVCVVVIFFVLLIWLFPVYLHRSSIKLENKDPDRRQPAIETPSLSNLFSLEFLRNLVKNEEPSAKVSTFLNRLAEDLRKWNQSTLSDEEIEDFLLANCEYPETN